MRISQSTTLFHEILLSSFREVAVTKKKQKKKKKKKQEMFQKHKSPLGAKFKITTYMCTRYGCNPCTKFGIDQMKGSKDIEQTTHWARKSGLTLTFEHVT